jgi:arylsulfatase A-like enzyme
MGTPRSLVLITVDCLRAGHVGFMGYDRPTTPFLDSLAAESLVLHNAIVAGSPTYYSFPAIMASRHPLAFGRDVMGIAPDEPTLATALSQSGYATAAFTAANVYISDHFGYGAGFDTFCDFLDEETLHSENGSASLEEAGNRRLRTRLNRSLMELSHKVGPLGSIYDELYFRYCQWLASLSDFTFDGLRRFPAADVIVNHSCDWLAGLAGKPFFLWLHLMDPHSPYYPAEEALRSMGDSGPTASRALYLNSHWRREDRHSGRFQRHRDEIITLYDAGVRWVDTQVARLVGTLRHQGLWENCVFAFSADHGEEFLDHGGRYHSPSKVTDELIRVPFLLRFPGVGGREPVKTPFSFLDLAPTLLDAVGIESPDSFRGHSRWKQLRNAESWDGTAVVECVTGCTNLFDAQSRMGARVLAIREERYKLTLDFRTGGVSLFDLENDPGELRPLGPGAEKPVRRRLLERARGHLADSFQSRDAGVRLRARLHDLRLEWSSNGNRASKG